MSAIRPIAIAVICRGDRILVFEGRDDVKGETFYRPLGGGIDFREQGADAVRRELREEIGAELREVRYLGLVENIFTLDGRPRHELVLVFQAELVDDPRFDGERVEGAMENGVPLVVAWKPLSLFAEGEERLYPTGLIDMLG